ncbi:MAG TPA: AAA domain-containing protein, partial [Candidatus Kapabacteria bacterium]|nr:AAA domain-containing protein [Candidatus Kapabacteria bacterium]
MSATTSINLSHEELARERLKKLFEFLKAFNERQIPPVKDLEEQPGHIWLNRYTSRLELEIFSDNNEESDNDDSGILIKLTKPMLTNCPLPPNILRDWLEFGWEKLDGDVIPHTTRNKVDTNGTTYIEYFESNDDRFAALLKWKDERAQWIHNEAPARRLDELFQTIYEWYGRLGREGESVELIIGDGILRYADETGTHQHPILLQRVELELITSGKMPQFIFRKRDRPPELYGEFLRSIQTVDEEQFAKCKSEISEQEFSPLGGSNTTGYLRRLIHGLFPTGGEYIDDNEENNSKSPSLQRNAVLFLRTRRYDAAGACDLVIEDIKNRELNTDTFSIALLQILGIVEAQRTEELNEETSVLNSEDEAILFSKPWNREQLQIAQQLDRKNCVLVQGPPGTGKTHTIANLLGHLLSQGKRILVTAKTTKALRVLREKVVNSLQPLCVSVLQNDRTSIEELQDSVQHINAQISQDEIVLNKTVNRLVAERHYILEELQKARKNVLDIRQDEIRNIIIAGKAYRPSVAAQLVAEGKGIHDWIPGPVVLGGTLPITSADIRLLYQTNMLLSVADERELSAFRPEIQKFPTPSEYNKILEELKDLATLDLSFGAHLWEDSIESIQFEAFKRMQEIASKAIIFLQDCKNWQLEAIQSGIEGGAAMELWTSLVSSVEETCANIQTWIAIVIKLGSFIPDPYLSPESLGTLDQIL